MPDGEWWQVLVGEELLEVRQPVDGGLQLRRGSERTTRHFFALDHDLHEIMASFPDDAYTREAAAGCRGLRILRQCPWECLATFITSSMKQVAHIRAMSLTLRERYGAPVAASKINAYPRAEVLAALSEADLRACGLGFRAPGMLGTARMVADGSADLEAWAAMPTGDLRERLCALPGVGRKIANCVILFAYGRLDAVPVDVWIARIAGAMRTRKTRNPQALEKFAIRRFGRYAGYVQQYLFHHARTTGKLPDR
jgi:N-glycosylase/DNA lyase